MVNHQEALMQRCARRRFLVAALSSLPIARRAAGQPGNRELVFSAARSVPLNFPATGFGITKVSPRGELCVLARDFRWLARASLADGQVSKISLEINLPNQIPAALGAASAQPFYDFAIGPAGESYIPVLGHIASPRELFSGVLIHRSTGEFNRFVRFEGKVNVRHLAVTGRGEIFAMGYDGAYFRGLADHNCVVHRFAPDGNRLASFSEEPLDRRGPGLSQRMAPMNKDLDRGDLWIQQDSTYQLMPVSKRLKIFTYEGVPLREVKFDSPESAGEPWIRRLIELRDGTFLVHWFLETGSGNSLRVGRQLALHGDSGRRISRMAAEPLGESLPVALAADGRVHFLRRSSGGEVHLDAVSVATR